METSLTWLGRLTNEPSAPDWRRLVEVYAPLLAGWLSKAGVAACDHDDLLQEVFMVIVRRVGEFEHTGRGAFRGWLRTILANHLHKYFRGRPMVSALDPDELAREDTALSRLWDRDHDEFFAARALAAVEVDFAPNTWLAFRRQVLEGVNAAEVALELGLSVNAVLLAKSRVLKRLRVELSELDA
jgi:RNA polymerase sigma-70 factor, ECF subfamily